MKWKLGLYRCHLCSILFGDTMVPRTLLWNGMPCLSSTTPHFQQKQNWSTLNGALPLQRGHSTSGGLVPKIYAALFSFWIKWTTQPFEGAVPCSNWTLVFYIFVQILGHLAPFVRRCPNLGTVIWKFRNLSLALLKNAWPENPPYDAYGFGCSSEKHWCMRMPPAKEFPGAFFLAMAWDVREVCTKLVQKQTQISIRRNLQYKHHLL